MNPATIASSFTVQKISKHHYLIRGDERIRTYMKFCELKWSNTYQGWIVHEDDEVDLLRMHMEVLDTVKENQKQKKQKDTSKTKKQTDRELYERFKRGEEITDDEDDEYEPSSDKTDDYEEDSFCVKDSTDEEEEEVKPAKKQSKKSKKAVESDSDDTNKAKKKKSTKDNIEKEVSRWVAAENKKSKKALEPEPEPEEEEEESEEEEENGETDPNRKREFQFYKRGILAYGMMTEKQQEKVEALWNKHLHGWIIRKSFQEKLQKMGWVDVEDYSSEKKAPQVVVHTPQVVSKKSLVKTIDNVDYNKPSISTPKTFESYKKMFLVKGELDLSAIAKTEAIFHPDLGGHLVSTGFRSTLVELGFVDKTITEETVKLSFSSGEKLELPVKKDQDK
jgi:hypothetical protein